MENTWITADWHHGETRLELMNRPYKSAVEMFFNIREKHNALVSPEDRVIVVGDAISKAANNPMKWLNMVKQLNGVKTLIRGNHDDQFSTEQLEDVFDIVVPEGNGIEIDAPVVGGEPIHCYATHYPTQGRADRFNIVGHVHAAWKFQLNSMNVGVDCNHFRPVSIKDIPFFYKAICEFYDNDVWVANHPVNSSYIGVRGKKGTYFQKKI